MLEAPLSNYLHTIRYLRPQQVYARLYRPRPRIHPSAVFSGRSLRGTWERPISRKPSQVAENRFCFLNQERTVASWNDPEIPKLWLYNLHYFESASGALIDRWVRENPVGTGNGWEPYPLAIRITNWIKWTLTGGELSRMALESLFLQADFLSQSLEFHLGANHLFANLTAMVMAGLFFQGEASEKWLASFGKSRSTTDSRSAPKSAEVPLLFGGAESRPVLAALELLRREIAEQILSDGGHYERSPMYHCLVLESILDLINLARASLALPERDLEILRRAASNMLGWLTRMTHPDGRISFFNDAAFDIGPEPVELCDYAARLGIMAAPVQLGESGYVRLESGERCVLFDAAPVGPDHQPGHAHADALSFELSDHGQRLLVNSGTSTYEKGAERNWQRGTSAHNTLRVDGQNQSEVWSAFRVARRARIREFQTDHRTYVEAAHDGYQRLTSPLLHRRRLEFTDRGILIIDRLEGRGRHRAELFFHFHPDADPEIHLDQKLSGSMESTYWYPAFNRAVRNRTLIGTWAGVCPVEFRTVICL